MLTLRQRLLIGGGAVVIVLAAIVAAIILMSKPKEQAAPTTGPTTIPIIDQNGQATEVKPEEMPVRTPVDPEKNYVKQLAIMFVERFATFSNQNENANIEDVLSICTANMQNWVKTQGLEFAKDYSGVTSEVFSSSLDSFMADKAIVMLGVNQTLSKQNNGTIEDSLKQKTGKVELTKVAGEWKVSGFWWK